MIKNKISTDSSSMERIIPDELEQSETTGEQTLALHLSRYEFAKENLLPGTVLDLACGVGYGTALLAASTMVTKATGVDISTEAIAYAVKHYGSERAVFLCCSALEFKAKNIFDNVVSLETIEHVDDPRALFNHLVSLIKPGGRLIASVPVTPSVDANPHHKSNFSASQFMHFGDAFPLKRLNTFAQIQPYSPLAILSRRERRTEHLRKNVPQFYLQHPSHLLLRLWSILKDGFANKYLTVVWEKRAQ
jgi:SAM-dependent methyltransferase